MRFSLSSIVALLLLCADLSPALAQRRPTIMIVGTTHFNNPNHDLNNMVVDDVLVATRQAEITQLVALLAQFKPTRIAIERTPADQSEFDRRLEGYRAGSYQLTADERDQVGVRLAALTGIARLDLVDYKVEPPGPAEAYDFQAAALAGNKRVEWQSFMELGRHYAEDETIYLRNHSLIDWFRRANSTESRAANNSFYYTLLDFDDEKARPGANWIGAWYRRNLAILENVLRVAHPNDRILVLFGVGHSYLLDQFAREGGRFEVVDVEKYLDAAAPTPIESSARNASNSVFSVLCYA